MNIFYTDNNPEVCAKNHCTIHTRKMIVEYTQLLSTAHHVLDGEEAIEGIYKKTHENHPCAKWVRQSMQNYWWLYSLTVHLCNLYTRSTGKVHKTSEVLKLLDLPPVNLQMNGFTEPPQCMPEEFHNESTEVAYIRYLESKYSEWQSREKPIKVEFYNDLSEVA